MTTVVETLRNPTRRAAIRAVWLSALLEGVVGADQVEAARVGRPVIPQERSYTVDLDGVLHTWEVSIPYPPDASQVRSLALLAGDGELLAVGGGAAEWSTTAFGGWAVVTLAVQRGDVWL